MARLITVALMSLIVLVTEIAFAKDYVLKIELTTEVETKVGNGKSSNKSELKAVEILITPERRFLGKTAWGKESMLAKGKLTEAKDGTVSVDIECGYSRLPTPGGGRPDRAYYSQPENEDHCSVKGKYGLVPGQAVFLGGSTTNETTNIAGGIRNTKVKQEFRVTLVEDESPE